MRRPPSTTIAGNRKTPADILRHGVRGRMGMGVAVAVAMASVMATAGEPAADDSLRAHTGWRLPSLDVPRAPGPVDIDARWDNPAWNEAFPGHHGPPGFGVIEALPLALGAPSAARPHPTRVLFQWTPTVLYVRFVVVDDDGSAPYRRPGVVGRDAKHYQSDCVEVFIDPVGDGRQTAELQVSADNEIFDQQILFTAAPSLDENGLVRNGREQWLMKEWNLDGLQTATAAFERDGRRGWIADLALPARGILRRTGRDRYAEGDVLRAHVQRYKWIPAATRPGDDTEPSPDLLPHTWGPVMFGNPHNAPGRQGFLRLRPAPTPPAPPAAS